MVESESASMRVGSEEVMATSQTDNYLMIGLRSLPYPTTRRFEGEEGFALVTIKTKF